MKKLNFDELVADFESEILRDSDSRSIKGGDRIYIQGGYVDNYWGGSTFCSDNGTSFDMPGVNVVAGGSAYQLNGTIQIDPSWATAHTLVHEFGHALQQGDFGNWNYYSSIPGSVWSAMTNSYNEHHNQPFEQQASSLGYEWVATWSPNFVY